MSKYECKNCGYLYDEVDGCEEAFVAEVENELVEGYMRDESGKCAAAGVVPGTLWKDMPKDFKCPLCGAPVDQFQLKTE